MIFGIIGSQANRLGSGKTLSAVWLALYIAKKQGLTIYSNIHLFGIKYVYIKHPRELIDVKKAVVILDDIYRWTNAYRSSFHINGLVGIIAGESRKRQAHYIYTSARLVGGVHKGLRDLTDFYVVPTYYKKEKMLEVTTYDGTEQPLQILPRLIPPNVVIRLFKYYDTYERVPILS